jgi:hypothetical protein
LKNQFKVKPARVEKIIFPGTIKSAIIELKRIENILNELPTGCIPALHIR